MSDITHPLCGTPCRVVGNTTKHYEPVTDKKSTLESVESAPSEGELDSPDFKPDDGGLAARGYERVNRNAPAPSERCCDRTDRAHVEGGVCSQAKAPAPTTLTPAGIDRVLTEGMLTYDEAEQIKAEIAALRARVALLEQEKAAGQYEGDLLRARVAAWEDRFRAQTGHDSPDMAGNVVINLRARVSELERVIEILSEQMPFEIAQGDQIRRLSPDSRVQVNTVATWVVGQEARSAIKVKDWIARLDAALSKAKEPKR